MNKLLLAILLVSPLAMADYVSPTEYKDFTCDELRADYRGLYSSKLSVMLLQSEYDYRTRRYAELGDKYESIQSRLAAIELAGKKIGCDVNEAAEK